MRIVALVAAALCLGAHADSPVGRVIKMMDKVKKDLVKVHDEEKETFNKFACWCEETTDRTATTIPQTRTEIERLGNAALAARGKINVMQSKISKAEASVKASMDNVEKATARRSEEHTEFDKTMTDLKNMARQLNLAYKALMGGVKEPTRGENAGSVENQWELISVAEKMRNAIALGDLSMNKADHHEVHRFLKNPVKFLQYSPASGKVIGMVTEMYDMNMKDMETSNREEATAAAAFERINHIEQTNVKDRNKDIKRYNKILADQLLIEASASEERNLAISQEEADTQLFKDTKAECDRKTKAYMHRSDDRQLEMKQIDEAKKILEEKKSAIDKSSNRESFRQTNLLQTRQKETGRFTEVIAAIKDLIKQKKDSLQEKKDTRDECFEKRKTYKHTKKDLESKKEVAESHEDYQESLSDKAKKDKEAADDRVSEIQSAQDTLKENREKEQKAFEDARDNDKETIEALKAARDQMKGQALIEEKIAEKPETGKTDMKYRRQGGGIVTLLDQMIGNIEKDMKQDEANNKKNIKAHEKQMSNLEDDHDKASKASESFAAAASTAEGKSSDAGDKAGDAGSELDALTNEADNKECADLMDADKWEDTKSTLDSDINNLNMMQGYLS